MKKTLAALLLVAASFPIAAQRPTGGSGGSGSSGPGTPTPEVKVVNAAVCNAGVAFTSGLSTYDSQMPQVGCLAPATSTAAYMSFYATPVLPQYATQTMATPPYWTGSDLSINFTGTATSGNVGWVVDSGCTNPDGIVSTVTYGTPVTLTTTVSTVAGGLVKTVSLANFAVPSVNGCVAGSLVTYRISRVVSDTQAGDAHLLSVILTTKRSQ